MAGILLNIFALVVSAGLFWGGFVEQKRFKAESKKR